MAALDYNENCVRKQKLDHNGELMFTTRTRKWELNQATLVPVLEDKTWSELRNYFHWGILCLFHLYFVYCVAVI